MPRWYVPSALAALVLLACSKQSTAVKEDSHPKPAPATVELAPEPAPPPAVPEGLSVKLEPDAQGTMRLRIQNRGQQALSMRPQLGVAKRGASSDLEGQQLSVRMDCDEAPSGCITLAPGAELLPAPLHLRHGDMQCGAGGPTLAAATYEVVVHGCEPQPYRAVTVGLTAAP